jgi:hypothetical protein
MECLRKNFKEREAKCYKRERERKKKKERRGSLKLKV